MAALLALSKVVRTSETHFDSEWSQCMCASQLDFGTVREEVMLLNIAVAQPCSSLLVTSEWLS